MAELPPPPVPKPISRALWRQLKRSIVAAACCGAISAATAERLIRRFNLREV